MKIVFHAHARERMQERGATKEEIELTINTGERFKAKFNRVGFRRNFPFRKTKSGNRYETKQVEVYGVFEANTFVVITVICKYF